MANFKETMSAFIDEEANEIETHRFLRNLAQEKSDRESHDSETSDQASLIKSFITFMSIRAYFSKQSRSQGISLADHESLFQRIRLSIKNEPTSHGLSMGVPSRKPIIGFAIAVSLLVIVSFFTQNLENSEPINVVEGDDLNQTSEDIVVESELRDLDSERQRHLREYLNEHDRIMRAKRASQLVNNQK